MSHVRSKQERALFETGHSVGRAIELPRHTDCVGHALPRKNTHVSAPYVFLLCTKVNAVCRGCHAGMLKTGPFEAMEIHNYLMIGFINMNIG